MGQSHDLQPQEKTQVETQMTMTDRIFSFCKEPHAKAEIAEHCGYKDSQKSRLDP